MKNIIEICKDFGFEIPADKHAEFSKAVAENYKTIAEHEKKVNRLTDDLAAEKKRADTAVETLKGFEGIDPANVKTQLEAANKKVKEAQEAAQKQLDERDFNDALKAELDSLKFTSGAARKAVESDIRAAGLKLRDGKILGLSDLIDQMKKDDASAFVDSENPPAQFTDPKTDKGNPGGKTDLGKLSMADYIAARKK